MLLEIRAVSADMGILETGRKDIVSVAPDATVEEIARTMFDQSVGSVLVEDNGHLEGIITDRDLVGELMTGRGAANVLEDASGASDLTAQDVMTPDPITVTARWSSRRFSGRWRTRLPDASRSPRMAR